MNNGMRLLTLSVVLAMLAVACSDGASETTTTTAAGTTTTAAAGTTTTTAAGGPSELRIAMVMNTVIDEPWNQTQADALLRIQQDNKYGLDVTVEFFEGIDFADAERVIGNLAASGKYDIIHGSSAFSAAEAPWLDVYPDIVFVYAGAGNEALGGNAYYIDMYIYECTYLAGIAAGMMTETGHVAAVAGFPFPALNNSVNGFIDGAQSVDPEIVGSATYIESWFDPVTAAEAAKAQLAAGADVLYASSFGTIQAAADAGAYGVGDYTDQEGQAPGAVLTSALARWDGAFNQIIDDWWDHEVNGTPYDAPLEAIQKLMAEDGCDIAPLNVALVPDEVRAAVAEARDKILSGELVVERDDAPAD